MKQELRKQITLLFVLILAVLGSCLLLWWARHGVVSRRAEVVSMLEDVASIETNRASMEREYQEFEAVKAATAELNKHFYDAQTIPLFLSDLEALAQEEGVVFEITSARVQGAPESNNQQVLVDFDVAGSYARLLAFSHALLAKPYHILFDRYYMLANTTAEGSASKKQATASWQLYGTLRLTTFK